MPGKVAERRLRFCVQKVGLLVFGRQKATHAEKYPVAQGRSKRNFEVHARDRIGQGLPGAKQRDLQDLSLATSSGVPKPAEPEDHAPEIQNIQLQRL